MEIDVKVDTANGSDFDYVLTKMEKLLAFGVEQVVWILTASRKIVVATHCHPSLTPYDWKQPVLLIDDFEMNLQERIQEGVSAV